MDFASGDEQNGSMDRYTTSLELPFNAVGVYGPPAVTQSRDSPDSTARKLGVRGIIRFSLKEERDRSEDRRRRALSRGVVCTTMETGRGRCSITPEEVVLGSTTSEFWDEDARPQGRFMIAQNPDLKKSE